MNKQYPESQVRETWTYKETQCSLVLTRLGRYCGYVRFPAKPVKEDSYHGILSYVPVHGGITYARLDNGGMEYGFDCAHSGDEDDSNTRNIDWLKNQCQKLADGIMLAAKYEDRYLLASGDNEKRADIIDEFTEKLGGLDMRNNFGAMLNVLSGQL